MWNEIDKKHREKHKIQNKRKNIANVGKEIWNIALMNHFMKYNSA